MTFAYYLSQNQASDIAVAANHKECPESLQVVLAAMANEQHEGSYIVLSRLAAKISRQFWQMRGC